MRRLGALVWIVGAPACASDDPAWVGGEDPAASREPVADPDESESDPGRDRGGHGGEGGGDTSPDDGPRPDAGSPDVPPEPGFVEVTEQVGLDLASGGIGVAPFCLIDNAAKPDETGDFCIPEHFLGAVAVGDVDDDGWPDLYVTRRGGPDRLLRNEGGTFVDVTGVSGLSHTHTIGAAAWADIDNDGDLDLVLTGFASDRHYLMVNNGYGHFSEQAEARGVALQSEAVHVGMGIGVGDFDLDGWLDLFVAEWRPDKELGDTADHNRLLRGLGSGYFHDVTNSTPLNLPRLAALVDAKAGVYGFAPAFADLDEDGWPELTLTGDFGTSRLLWNDAGRFVDGTWPSGVGTERNGMGSTFGDFDGDGDIDWFVSAIWTDDFPLARTPPVSQRGRASARRRRPRPRAARRRLGLGAARGSTSTSTATSTWRWRRAGPAWAIARIACACGRTPARSRGPSARPRSESTSWATDEASSRWTTTATATPTCW